MTSIAAYLAGLSGGAPQEGQKANQATATGASGLFVDLLVSSDGDATAIDGAVTGENPLGLLAEGQLEVLDGQISLDLQVSDGTTESIPVEIAGNDLDLSEILTDGLAQASGDVEAEIIDSDGTGAIIADAEVPATNVDAEPAVPEVTPEQAKQAVTIDADIKIAVPAAGITVSAEAGTQQPAGEAKNNDTAPAGAAAETQQAQPEASARNGGLENTLQRGAKRGLQNALTQAPQAKANGQSQGASGEANAHGGQSTSSEGETGRPQMAASIDDDASIRTRQGRAEAATRDVTTFQRILDAGNGKKVIQINERIGGEAAGTTSPPTLTVNVSASAASPGPASPNTPHVPVSALAVHIAQQFKNGARRFDIRLDPPELGRIDVRLDVSRDGQVSTHLVVERAETLDLLQRDARQLERALQDAGLDTSKEDMKFSLKDQGLEQGEQENAASDDNDNFASKRDTADDQAEMMDEAMPPPTRYLATAGLDIRI